MLYINITNYYNNNYNNFNINVLNEKGGDVYKRYSLRKEDFKAKNGALKEKKLKRYIKDNFREELQPFNYISILEIN